MNEASHAIRDMQFTLVFPIFMAFIGPLAWAFIFFWIIFGAFIWHNILGCTTKAICKSIHPGSPSEVNINFDPSSGMISGNAVELVVGNNNNTNVVTTTVPPNAPNNNNGLPPGWRQVTHTDGRIYYQNDITKETSWDKPAVILQQQPVVAPVQQQYVPQQAAAPVQVQQEYVKPQQPYQKMVVQPQQTPQTGLNVCVSFICCMVINIDLVNLMSDHIYFRQLLCWIYLYYQYTQKRS